MRFLVSRLCLSLLLFWTWTQPRHPLGRWPESTTSESVSTSAVVACGPPNLIVLQAFKCKWLEVFNRSPGLPTHCGGRRAWSVQSFPECHDAYTRVALDKSDDSFVSTLHLLSNTLLGRGKGPQCFLFQLLLKNLRASLCTHQRWIR